VIEGIERRNTPYRGDAFEFYRVVVDEQARLDQAIASGKKGRVYRQWIYRDAEISQAHGSPSSFGAWG